MRLKKFFSVFFFLSLALLFLLFHPFLQKEAYSFFGISESQEIEMGRETHPEILEEFGLYDDPKLNTYVNEVGQKLARVSDRRNLPYHFTVLDSPVVNALAIPGGYVYVTRGLLALCNSEAEMAGVIGHEIGHITAKHSVKQISRTQTYSILSTILAVVDRRFAAFKRISDTAASLIFLKYSRDNEREADYLGLKYAYRAGYNPEPLVSFLETLLKQEQKEEEGSHPHFLSTPTTTRDRLLQSSPKLTTTGYNVYKSHLDGMIYGKGEKEGVIERGIYYKNRFAGVALTIPQGWKKQTSRLLLQINHPYQNYHFQFQIHELKKRGDTYSFARDIEKKMGLPRASFQRISLSDFDGLKAVYSGRTEGGGIRLDIIYLLDPRKNIGYTLISINPLGDERNANYYFSGIIRSFRKLSPSEIEAIKIKRIRIHNVAKDENFYDISRKYYGDQNRAKEIAEFNGLTVNTALLPGEKLKIIVSD
jgi:predicted Zn-dependent protease